MKLLFGKSVGAVAFAGAMGFALSGCSGVEALSEHGDLDVHTHTSETVFLDPVPASQKTVYIGVRNTSDYPEIDVRGPLMQALQARGYTIVDGPDSAHYMLQANVLQAGKLDDGARGRLLGGGYGQPLLAGALAGGITGAATNSWGAATGVGLGVTAATMLFNAAYQDVTYAVTVDIQISERPLHGARVHQYTHNHRGSANYRLHQEVDEATPTSFAASGGASVNSTNRDQFVEENADYKQYQVRDVAYADKVNLKMQEAVPILAQRLTSSLANLFE